MNKLLSSYIVKTARDSNFFPLHVVMEFVKKFLHSSRTKKESILVTLDLIDGTDWIHCYRDFKKLFFPNERWKISKLNKGRNIHVTFPLLSWNFESLSFKIQMRLKLNNAKANQGNEKLSYWRSLLYKKAKCLTKEKWKKPTNSLFESQSADESKKLEFQI